MSTIVDLHQKEELSSSKASKVVGGMDLDQTWAAFPPKAELSTCFAQGRTCLARRVSATQL